MSHSTTVAVKRFHEGRLQLSIYENRSDGRTYTDAVIYKKVHRDGEFRYRRGVSLSPDDLNDLQSLLKRASAYLEQTIN